MTKKKQSTEAIVLEDHLDLLASGRLHSALMERRGGSVVIDASNVAHLGAQSLQVLIAACATWRSDKSMLEISNSSPAFMEALSRFGVPIDALTHTGEAECR